MKKLILLGLCLALTTGCGRSWFPRLFRGAPCGGGCASSAPPADPVGNCGACPNAETGAGYGGYESYGKVSEQVVGSSYLGEQPVEGAIMSGGSYNAPIGGGIITSPSTMAPLAPATPAR